MLTNVVVNFKQPAPDGYVVVECRQIVNSVVSDMLHYYYISKYWLHKTLPAQIGQLVACLDLRSGVCSFDSWVWHLSLVVSF